MNAPCVRGPAHAPSFWDFTDPEAPKAPFPLFKLGAYWACETPDGILAIAGKLPWGELPPFFTDLPQARISYTAFRGWHAHRWHDGPLFFVAQQRIQRCVLPGAPAQIPLLETNSDPQSFAAWIEQHEALAWKKSLAFGFREGLALDAAAYRLENLQSSAQQALVLLGLRVGFPQIRFYTLNFPESLKPQWKRYCQNLNCSTWAAPTELAGLTSLNGEELGQLWPEDAAHKFLQALQSRVPVLPEKLLKSFSAS